MFYRPKITYSDDVSYPELIKIHETINTLYQLVEHQNKILLHQMNQCHPALHRIIAKFIDLNLAMTDSLLTVLSSIKKTEDEVFAELNAKSA